MINELMYLYPNAIPSVDFKLQDNGTGPFITYWNTAKLGTQPTATQITNATNAAELLYAQSAQIALLQASFKAAMTSPVPFTNAAGVASSYPNMDTISFNGKTAIQNIESVINAGSAAWTFAHWLDVNGVAQTFTFADVQGLASAMAAQDTPSELNLVAKIGQVQAATTVSAVQAITF
jgi:hypothetical protein